MIVAPAGYGKTFRLIEAMAGGMRCLVLTHTNVAVSNIKRRSRYQPLSRVETLDSLARRLASGFPSITGVSEECLDWMRVRNGAVAVLQRPAIRDAFAGSYDQVLVDEYQDCSPAQVELVRTIAKIIPTLVFGDPLQSLYDSLDSGAEMSWEDKVHGWEALEPLNHPWRWDHNPAHRAWVVAARAAIDAGQLVSLKGPTAQHQRVSDTYGAFLSDLLRSRPGRWAIISGDAKRTDRLEAIAKSHRWNSVEVVERSQLPELDELAERWDAGNPAHAILALAKKCMSNCGKITSFTSCLSSTERRASTRGRSPLSSLVAELQAGGSPAVALQLIELIESASCTGTHRPGLLNRAKRSLRTLRDPAVAGLATAVSIVQGQVRAGVDRAPAGPQVGTVLRLKGLEFDHVAITNPAGLSTPQELYVALSRARDSCTIVTSGHEQLRWLHPAT